MLSVKLSGHSFVFLSPLLCCACRERMVFQGQRGRWEQRGMLGTMELQGLEAKMDLKVPKASWVPRGRLDLLVFPERRYRANHSWSVKVSLNNPNWYCTTCIRSHAASLFRVNWEYLDCQDFQGDRGQRWTKLNESKPDVEDIMYAKQICASFSSQGSDGFPGSVGALGEKGKKVSRGFDIVIIFSLKNYAFSFNILLLSSKSGPCRTTRKRRPEGTKCECHLKTDIWVMGARKDTVKDAIVSLYIGVILAQISTGFLLESFISIKVLWCKNKYDDFGEMFASYIK